MKYICLFENFNAPLLSLGNVPDIKLMNKILSLKKRGKVLEIGSGNGSDAKYLAKKGFDVTCVENNKEYYSYINSLGIKCLYHDIKEPLSLEDKFDIIYARLALHYFNTNELKDIFTNLYNLTNKNGYIIYTVKLEDDSFNTNKVILSDNIYKEITESVGYKIVSSNIYNGKLYSSKSKWLELIGKK